MTDTYSKVTRLEIIDHSVDPEHADFGRRQVFWDEGKQIQLMLQDEGRTLKIRIFNRGQSPESKG